MESRIIYHIDKFVAFLFGENNKNDPEQRIYKKLLRLEGEELETWMNEKVKTILLLQDVIVIFMEKNLKVLKVQHYLKSGIAFIQLKNQVN
jgi:hypothetical protein